LRIGHANVKHLLIQWMVEGCFRLPFADYEVMSHPE
jgi:hypothetical protein